MHLEIDDRAAPDDSRKIVVNGYHYHKKTDMVCPTCAQPDRWLYLKQILNNGRDLVIECPICTYCVTILNPDTK